MNNHLFTDDFLSAVFKSVNNSGVDYIELGYKADESQFSRSEYGSMKFCSENDIEKVIKFSTKIGWYTSLVPIHTTTPSHPMPYRTIDYTGHMNFKKTDEPKIEKCYWENVKKYFQLS